MSCDTTSLFVKHSETLEEKNKEHGVDFLNAPYPIMTPEEREERLRIGKSISRPKAQPIDYKSSYQLILKHKNNDEKMVNKAMEYLIFILGLRNHRIPQFNTIKEEIELFGKPICMFNGFEKKYFEEWMDELEMRFESFSMRIEVSVE